jgi:hypothetical protein
MPGCGRRSVDVVVLVYCVTLCSSIICIWDSDHRHYVIAAEDSDRDPPERGTDPTSNYIVSGLNDSITELILTDADNNEELMATTTTSNVESNNNHDNPSSGHGSASVDDNTSVVADDSSMVSQSAESALLIKSKLSSSSSSSPITSAIDRLLKHFLSLDSRLLSSRRKKEETEVEMRPVTMDSINDVWRNGVTEDYGTTSKGGSSVHRKESSDSTFGGLPYSQSSQSSASSSVPLHRHNDDDDNHHSGLYNFKHRFARACTGEDECEDELYQKYHHHPLQDDEKGSENVFKTSFPSPRHSQARPEMILQIFQRTNTGSSVSSSSQRKDDGRSGDNNMNSDDSVSNRNSIKEMEETSSRDGNWLEISDQESSSSSYGIRNGQINDGDGSDFVQCNIYGDSPGTADLSSYFKFERAYALEEPMLLELGVVPRHYVDFAYTPVMSREWSGMGRDNNPPNAACNNRLGNGMVDCSDHRKNHQSEAQQPTGDESTSGVQIVHGPSDKVLVPSNTAHAPPLSSWWQWWFPFTSSWWQPHGTTNGDYEMGKSAFAGGSHGEVWRGRRICTRPTFLSRGRKDLDCDDKQPLVLKKLRVERGYRLLEAGLREVYFGNLIRKQIDEQRQDFFTVYVDHFFREVPQRTFGRVQTKDLELWIVFEDAGPSLRSYMYTATVSGGFMMYQHSRLWTQLRTFSLSPSYADHDEEDTSLVILHEKKGVKPERQTNRTTTSNKRKKNRMQLLGKNIMRNILQQILSAAAALHDKGIVHRDMYVPKSLYSLL